MVVPRISLGAAFFLKKQYDFRDQIEFDKKIKIVLPVAFIVVSLALLKEITHVMHKRGGLCQKITKD